MNTIISLLTDFGVTDTSVGQCKGVIAGIAPKATVIDITHAVPHFDVATGSWLLRNAAVHFPPSVHVAVVDPGVGTARRGIAIECGRGDYLIGPDNGLLVETAEQLGGIIQVVELTHQEFHHQPVSNTFHARDIFCPAAAHISHGVSLHLLGDTVDPATLVRLPARIAAMDGGTLHTAVATVNEYGTLALTAAGEMLTALGSPRAVRVRLGDRRFGARVVRTFGEADQGETVLLIDSYGQLSLARNCADLAASLGLSRTDRPAVSIEADDEASSNHGEPRTEGAIG